MYPGAYFNHNREYLKLDDDIEKIKISDRTIGWLKIFGSEKNLNNLPIIVLFHGNASYADEQMAKHTQIINNLEKQNDNFAILSIEYSSYLPKHESVKKHTKANQTNLEKDAQATYNYLTKTKNINPKNLTFYGESLGSYPTLFLASKNKEANKYIVNCPLSSTQNKILWPSNNRLLNALLLPFNILIFLIAYPFIDQLNNHNNIKKAANDPNNNIPIEIIADNKDRVLPPKHHAKQLEPYASTYTELHDTRSKSGAHHIGNTTIEHLYKTMLPDILNNHSHSNHKTIAKLPTKDPSFSHINKLHSQETSMPSIGIS